MTDPSTLTAEMLLEQLRSNDVAKVAKQYKFVLLPKNLVQDLLDTTTDTYLAHLFLASCESTPSSALRSLVLTSKEPEILFQLANHRRLDCQNEIYMQIATMKEVAIRINLASQKKLSVDIAKVLCKDENALVRSTLAENSDVTDAAVQMQLASDGDSLVRASLLLNKNICNDAIELLKHDSNFSIRLSTMTIIIKTENELLKVADDDANACNQSLLFEREDLSEVLLESLALSHNEPVRTEAIKRKLLKEDELLALVQDPNINIRKIIAERKNLPEFIQQIICNDLTDVKLVFAGAFPNLNSVKHLLEEEYLPIQIKLMENKNLEPEAISYICSKVQNVELLELISLRDDLNDEHLKIIVNERRHKNAIYNLAIAERFFIDIDEILTEELSLSEAASLRCFAAHSRNINDRIVDNLLADRCINVKIALLKNPMLEDEEVAFLLSDSKQEVVVAATREIESRKKQQEIKDSNQIQETKSNTHNDCKEIISNVKSFVNNILDKVIGK